MAKGPINTPIQSARELARLRDAAERYAALGRACEANGLAGFNIDGSLWFQPPQEVIEEAAQAPFGQPVGYRVKDFADGWIPCKTFQEAVEAMPDTGALIQAVYVRKVGE